MLPEESLEVQPSEDSGNVPAMETTPETPNEETTEPAVEETPTETSTPSEPELYELPDGRKVDAETLSREWKENFYPDYTRKSQDLAALKTKEPEPTNINKPTDPLADPEYTPQSWEEVAAQIESRTLARIASEKQAEVEARQALENEVVTQLNEVKTIDPTLNENALFLHATKYQFRDLKMAHQNMKDMAEMAKKVQATTATNIAKRNDPVSTTPGATGTQLNPDHFATSVEYLRALKGK